MRVRVCAAVAAAFVVAAPGAMAQQVTGGSITLSHSAFTEDSDVSKTSLTGSVEVGFSRDFSVQFDLGGSRLNFADETVTTGVLHGIYHLNANTSAGVFVGLDRAAGESLNFVGFEFGHMAGRTGFEAYVGRGEEQGVSGTLIGLSTRYAATEQLGVGVSLDQMDVGPLNATRYSLNGDYAVTSNVKVFGEIGAARAEVLGLSDSEGYVKIGGKFTFGAKRGTTFGQRSVLNILPGL